MDLHCREISMPFYLTVPISALFCPKRVALPPSQEKRSSRLLVQPHICRRWMSLACRLEAASVNCFCNVNEQFNYAAKFESEPGLHSHSCNMHLLVWFGKPSTVYIQFGYERLTTLKCWTVELKCICFSFKINVFQIKFII